MFRCRDNFERDQQEGNYPAKRQEGIHSCFGDRRSKPHRSELSCRKRSFVDLEDVKKLIFADCIGPSLVRRGNFPRHSVLYAKLSIGIKESAIGRQGQS
jgi:hypothetical protein